MSEHPINTAPRASFERVVDALAAAGITVKDTHGGAKSACPLAGHKHGDTTPSLSIQYVAKDGRTRIRCHLPEHMGREEDILRVIGLGFADLYDQPKTSGPGRSSSTSSRPRASKRPQQVAAPEPATTSKAKSANGPRPEIVARYDYLDAAGVPVLRVLRYDPKGFRQQKHDGKRWVWGAPAAEDRVLYRLPEVRAAAQAGATIHLAEGEKDADALAAAAAPEDAATTAPMGADKWQPQYTEQLRGAGLVVLWRDKDNSGSRHVRTVSEQLTQAQIPWQIVEAAEGKDAADHLAAGLGLDEVVPVELEEEEPAAPVDVDAAADVVAIKERRLPSPEHVFPMGRGTWAYEDGGEGRRPRGVYTYQGDEGGWRRVAPMPFIHKRIAQRDGTGRRTSTAYLASAEVDGPRVVITHDHLRSASWANMLGLALSADDKITKAATTAIIYAAERAAECEETPRVISGRVSIPSPETLPAGYLQTSRYSVDEAKAGWVDLIQLIAQSPKMALVVGASAIAPFVAATRRQSHFVYLYGDAAQGKTVALNTAGAIWGLASASPEDDGARVVTPWNASAQGPFRFLGELGVLPPLWDEIGQASYQGAQQWGKFIFDVCEGARRITPGMRGAQTHYGRPWHGIFIAAGNGRLLDGLGAGRYAGITRRVIELPTPMTLDEAHADEISAKWEVVYGHAGLQLLEQHSAETVRPLIDAAAAELEAPESAVGRNIARHLYSHIAGAALLDAWAGTGTLLRDAARTAAIEYLESWAEPEHDADRMLNAIRDAMDREPAKWPTIAADRAARALFVPGLPEVEMPRHGVDRSLSGLRDDDDEWVAVYAATWRAICADLGLDSAVTARELHKRGVLQVTEAKRRRGEWVTQIRAASSATGMYKLLLPSLDEDLEEEQPSDEAPHEGASDTTASDPSSAPDSAGGVGGEGVGCGSDVGTQNALTCDVVGGVGVVGENSHVRAREVSPQSAIPELLTLRGEKPCVICRTPARHSLGGDPIHTGQCMSTWLEDRPTQPQPSQPAPESAPSSTSTTAKGPRFRAPAAVVDGTTAYLPAAEVVEIEAPRHLGDLALLVRGDRLALGHGGDRERRPDHGQVWLTAATLTGLGLPLELPDDDKPRANALAQLRSTPAVADAIAEGWSLGQQGQMREWTRIWHTELLPQGAWLVAHPWQRLDAALLEGELHPAELAARLAEFAYALGLPYRISPTVTGLDLIDHTRPPLEAGDEPGVRAAVVRNEPGEMPAWLRKMDDPRARNVEQDWSWWRLWSSLGEEEKGCRYVHLYDRNKAYFSSWSGVELGVSGLVHLEGDQAAWDGSERPAYFRIDRPQWHHTHLPDPAMHLGYPLNDGTIWCTVHTLKTLAKHDVTPTIHEAYTWSHTARYLDKAAKKLSTLLSSTEPGPITRTAKELYTRTTGKLAEIDHDPNYHLWRPDWRDHVIGLNKAMILRSISQTGERTGRYPLVVAGRDTIAYASNDPDPVSGWPGQPGHLGPKPGQWKPAGSGELQPWGPTHLVKRVGRWRPRAFDDLTS